MEERIIIKDLKNRNSSVEREQKHLTKAYILGIIINCKVSPKFMCFHCEKKWTCITSYTVSLYKKRLY